MKQRSGWYPDPYFPGHEQFWDGRQWTGQRRAAPAKKSRRRSAPPPPPPPPPDFETATAPSEPARTPRHAAPPSYWDKAAPQSLAASGSTGFGRHAAASPMPPVTPRKNPEAATAGLTASFTRADDAVVRTTGPITLERRPETGNGAGKLSPGPAKRSRWRPIVRSVAVLVVVVVLAAGAVALLRHKFGTSANTPVANAAAATLNAGTATMAFAVNPAGGQAPASSTTVSGLSGNGGVDFASGAAALTLTEPAGAGSAGTTQQMIVDDQTLYLAPGPFVDQLEKGKAWISGTVDDLGASGTPSGFEVPVATYEELIGNPVVLLEQLQGAGVTATALGSSTYDGTPVRGYAVTLPGNDIEQRLSPLPAPLRGAVSGMSATEDVYVTTGGLVRAISVPAALEANGQSMSEDVQVLFSGWGGPVQVAPPPTVSVMTWAKLNYILNSINRLH